MEQAFRPAVKFENELALASEVRMTAGAEAQSLFRIQRRAKALLHPVPNFGEQAQSQIISPMVFPIVIRLLRMIGDILQAVALQGRRNPR